MPDEGRREDTQSPGRRSSGKAAGKAAGKTAESEVSGRCSTSPSSPKSAQAIEKPLETEASLMNAKPSRPRHQEGIPEPIVPAIPIVRPNIVPKPTPPPLRREKVEQIKIELPTRLDEPDSPAN
jgi:hypothetical protein